jgi:hypothetical protein
LYAVDGSIVVTIVDGTTYTGLYAADGSWNVTEDGTYGLYHPCGAYRVTVVDGSTYTGIQAADGSWNVTNAETDGKTGFQHPCGAIRMTGIIFSPLSLAPSQFYLPEPQFLFEEEDGTGIITATEAVGYMTDQGSGADHLLQATAGSRPTYQTSGGLHWLEGDGSDDHLIATFALSQPFTRVSAWRVLTNANKALCGGTTGAPAQLFWYQDATPFLSMGSGSEAFFARPPPALNDDFVSVEIYNGASSSLQIDAGSATVDNPGSDGVHGGLTLLASQGGNVPSNARFYGMVVLPRVATAGEIAKLVTYLAAKQGRVL